MLGWQRASDALDLCGAVACQQRRLLASLVESEKCGDVDGFALLCGGRFGCDVLIVSLATVRRLDRSGKLPFVNVSPRRKAIQFGKLKLAAGRRSSKSCTE